MYSKGLSELNLSRMPSLTDSGLLNLVSLEELKNLTVSNLDKPKTQVTLEGLEKLKQQRPGSFYAPIAVHSV
jgi:hypothetical protein